VNRDPKGYYARLAVPTDASATAIKAAFRRLAKELHPDVNANPGAAEEFSACSEAYEVLNDPDKRAAYDNAVYEKAAAHQEPNEQLEPINCSVCRKPTAQPRNVVFRSVVSLLITTVTNPIQGIFCSDCARKAGFRASIISGLFGWWGVPWGPINTIKEIIRNSLGGERKQELDDRLAYYNAVAFGARGNLSLAHAIARQLRNAKDEGLALDALRLVDELERAGVQKGSPALKSGWDKKADHWAVHGASLVGVPAAICLAVALTGGGNSNAAAGRPYVPSTYKESGAAPPIVLPLEPAERVVPPALCADPPSSGDELQRDGFKQDGHRITIENGGSGNALVKVRDDTGKRVATLYVARSRTGVISNLPDGRYRILFAVGDQLDASCAAFAGDFQAQQFPDIETFETVREGDQIMTSDLKLTLHSVVGGNVRPRGVSEASFDAE